LLGSAWAYYVLGWGGWWFWDPVENASFMPWLVGTALLHSAIVVEKRDTLKSWTILLAILTFSLSLLGTFIVRSGVLTSVHAFASDPARGIFILAFLVLVVGGSLVLFAFRAPAMKPGGAFAPISRETGIVLNNLILAVAAFAILSGTLYPLFANELGYQVSVAAPFFNIVFPALMALLVLFMGLGPLLAWKRGNIRAALDRLRFPMVIAVVSMLSIALLTDSPWWASVAIGYGVWLTASVLAELAGRLNMMKVPLRQSIARAAGLPRSAWGMTVAHLGIAVMIFGIAASSAWEQERITVMNIGETVELGPYQITLDSVGPERGPNYTAVRGTFSIYEGEKLVTRLTPETRRFSNPPQETTEAAIYPLISGDLYAVIAASKQDGRWGVRLYHKPLISWIWAGALIMVLGGSLSLSDRRLRVGAPKPAAKSDAVPAGAPAE
ncbi:MAG: cytochrome c biogenesis protein CcsA, partial [Proteobacteria bacterium]|nr:cytochrome c biogenesis protein CcsA [Pseudomonadota bacterium]